MTQVAFIMLGEVIILGILCQTVFGLGALVEGRYLGKPISNHFLKNKLRLVPICPNSLKMNSQDFADFTQFIYFS